MSETSGTGGVLARAPHCWDRHITGTATLLGPQASSPATRLARLFKIQRRLLLTRQAGTPALPVTSLFLPVRDLHSLGQLSQSHHRYDSEKWSRCKDHKRIAPTGEINHARN